MGLAFGRMGCLLAAASGRAPACRSRSRSRHGAPRARRRPKLGELASAREWSSPRTTEIHESAFSLAIAAFCLFYVLPRKRYDGQVFVAFMVLYPVARFLVEILRRDARGGALGLSTSQLIGLGLLAAAALIHKARAPAPRPAAASSD